MTSPAELVPDVWVAGVFESPATFRSSRARPALKTASCFRAPLRELKQLSEPTVDLLSQFGELDVDRANCADDQDHGTGDGSDDLDPIVGGHSTPSE